MHIFDISTSTPESGADDLSFNRALEQIQHMGFKYKSNEPVLVSADTPDDEIIETHRELIANLMEEDAYDFVEVIRLKRAIENNASYIYKEVRDPFETRLITHGHCSLFIRFNGQILELVCKSGDLIRIPAQLCYWLEGDVQNCHYIHLYSSQIAWDRVTSKQDFSPCALQEAG